MHFLQLRKRLIKMYFQGQHVLLLRSLQRRKGLGDQIKSQKPWSLTRFPSQLLPHSSQMVRLVSLIQLFPPLWFVSVSTTMITLHANIISHMIYLPTSWYFCFLSLPQNNTFYGLQRRSISRGSLRIKGNYCTFLHTLIPFDLSQKLRSVHTFLFNDFTGSQPCRASHKYSMFIAWLSTLVFKYCPT